MPSSKQFNLNTAIRQTIEELLLQGNLTTREVCDLVMDRYPDLCQDAYKSFMRETIASRARRMMKREAKMHGPDQAVLPLEIKDIRIPSNISLPPEDGEMDMQWSPIERASFNELTSHIDFLQKSVDADLQKLQAMQKIQRLLDPEIPEDKRDVPIGPWLRRISMAA